MFELKYDDEIDDIALFKASTTLADISLARIPPSGLSYLAFHFDLSAAVIWTVVFPVWAWNVLSFTRPLINAPIGTDVFVPFSRVIIIDLVDSSYSTSITNDSTGKSITTGSPKTVPASFNNLIVYVCVDVFDSNLRDLPVATLNEYGSKAVTNSLLSIKLSLTFWSKASILESTLEIVSNLSALPSESNSPFPSFSIWLVFSGTALWNLPNSPTSAFLSYKYKRPSSSQIQKYLSGITLSSIEAISALDNNILPSIGSGELILNPCIKLIITNWTP